MEVIKSAYEGVEEQEQKHTTLFEIGDTYMESSIEEYDTSNNVNRRKQSAHGNLYDTAADIRGTLLIQPIILGGEQLLHYSPYGVNWNKASLSCGINGLEIVEEVLKRSDVLENQQFWIGKTPIFTPWMELIGCYEVHGLNKTELSSLNTRSECQKKCQHVKHFGFKKTSSRRCVCIPDEVLIDKQKNMSACEESYFYYVYNEFRGKVVDSDDPGNCMTLCCGDCSRGNTESYMFEGRNCDARDLSTVARCEDRNSSYWGATQNEGLTFCASKQQLLLPSTFCHEPGNSKFSGIKAWTNVFREQITECFTTNCTTTRYLCPAGVINSVEGTKGFKQIEKACNESLQWFICSSNRSPITDQALYTTMFSSGMISKQIIDNQGNTETTLVKGISSGVTSFEKVTNECQQGFTVTALIVFASSNVHHVSNGITWLEASTRCGEKGLEDNEDKLKDSDIQIEIEFWIGRAVYSELTPWIEVLDYNGTIKDDLRDPGNCVTVCCGDCKGLQRDILMGRNCFATNDNIVGRCIPFNEPDQKWGQSYNNSRFNCWQKDKLLLAPSFCTHTTDSSHVNGVRAWTNVFREKFRVEKSGLHQNPTLCYKGILHNIGNETKQLDISLRNCNDGVKWFICRNTTIHDSQRSTTGITSPFPSLEVSTLQQSSTNLSPVANTVQHYTTAVSLHGTSFNRESSTETRSTSVGNAFDTKAITIFPQPSTNRKPADNSMKKDNTNSYTGVIICGTIGAFLLLIISATIFVCRKKSIGVFKGKKKTNDNNEEFSQTPNYDLQCVKASHVEPIANQNYGIGTNQSSTYAVVDKLKKSDKKFTNNDETYTDSSDGQYDQLNDVQKRKIILGGNMYESHEGMRDQNDPTYDISNFSGSHEVTDVYDHSFLGTQHDGEYDYSSTYRRDLTNETEMYDKTV
ncbi:unnamed protein product [Mytilus coruscus]|uniref:WSC domain-containing protein n=1 Tax=Mytilus coruscus TaxID=42192 RepID=A0A6J8EV29_MYTCO|nr:unnamed protein product [Mytilus coruscus]